MAQPATRTVIRTAPERTSRIPRGIDFRRGINGYLFILPTFIFIGYFLYYPAWVALSGAFTSWDGFNDPQFVGLENFQRAMSDKTLGVSTINNLIWAVAQIFLSLVPPFLVAELIFHVKRQGLQYLYRTLFTIPLVIPSIVSILLWRYFYASEGLINFVLRGIGLGSLTHTWIRDPDTALYALIFMGFPWISAFNLLIFYAGLQGINQEVLESASLDGATSWRRIRSMHIPLIKPQIKLLFILSVIGSVQHLLVPLLMTNGGPGYSTYVPLLHMYTLAIKYGEFGYSMAISFLMFLVILILTIINMRYIRTED